MLYDAAGWLGAFLLLLAYGLVSGGKVSPSSRIYHLINLAGASGIFLNTLAKGAIPAMVLNIVWALVALYSLFKISQPKPN